MIADHRQILATGIARLRAKIKYNPVVFELMPPRLHAAATAAVRRGDWWAQRSQAEFPPLDRAAATCRGDRRDRSDTGGRPAKAYRFRAAVREERAIAGTKLPLDPGLTSLILMISISQICSP